MEEDTELEEGEACFNKDDDNNIDLDSLSYIDERIQHVLGHFQKDFEGGVCAENLGATFGGYGSFLPTYERPCVRSDMKPPQRNYSSLKSPKNLHMEAASGNSKSSSIMPPSMSLGTVSGIAQSFHTLRVPSVDYSKKKDVGISSNAVAERCPLKDDSINRLENSIKKKKNRLGNSTDQRTLKFRIKVKSNLFAQKNAEIYSGLGLDNSPSSSMGNSHEENGCMPSLSQSTAEESPTGIIQAMSSFPIPGGVLLSPLHDSLLNLMRKEKVFVDKKSTSSLNGSQEHYSVSTDESDSLVGDGQLLKRKVRIVGQSKRQLELKHKNGDGFEKETTLNTAKRLENITPDRKDFLSNGLKCTPLSSLICDAGEPAEVTGKASDVSLEVNEDGAKGRMVSSEAVKEESLESISGQDFDKSDKQRVVNSFMGKVLKQKLANPLKDDSTDPKINGNCKADMISKKTECDTSEFKVNKDPHKCETSQKGKLLSEGKNNSKGDRSPSKVLIVGGKDSFGASNNAVIPDKKTAVFDVTCKIQMHKTKSLKDKKIRDSNRDSMTEKKLEPPGHRAITKVDLDSNKERSAYRVKVKERPRGDTMGNQLIAEPCKKDVPNAHPVAENNLAPEMLPAAAPQVIAEDWVCCDSCQKWRLLPMGIKPEQLPEKWLCSMLTWLPGMNRCDINEEETTKAVYALSQIPITEGQKNIESQATGTAIRVSSADALHLGRNHQKSTSDVMSGRGKKKHDFKEKTKEGISSDVFLFSKSLKNNAQVSSKVRGLTDMNQHPGNSNLVKKSCDKNLIRLNNLTEEKHMPIEKVKQLNGGDTLHIKLKRKMEADPYRSGTPKKSKTEDVYYTDSKLNPDMDLNKMGLNSRKPMKASGKDMRKYDEYCLSEEVEGKVVVPVRKLRDNAQVLSDGVPLGATNSSKKDVLMKKRKLKDWMDNKNHNLAMPLQDDIQYGEEGSVRGFKKEKKYKVIKAQPNSDTEGDNDFDRKGGMSQICLSVNRDHMAVDAEEVRSVEKAQQQRKHRKKITSRQTLDGSDPLGRDLSSGKLSLAVTSSCSMISGSLKARSNFEDVKFSPVESITSSPLRTSNLEKLIFTEGDTSGKDPSAKGGRFSTSSKGCLDNKVEKQSTKGKKRVLNDCHPEWNNFSSKEYPVEDGKAKVQAKTTYEGRNNHLPSGSVHTTEHASFANGTPHEDRTIKNNLESAFSRPESGKITSMQGEERVRRCDSEGDRDKMKVSVSENGYSKIGGRTKNLENSVLKVDVPCRTNGNVLSQQKLIQDLKEEDNADSVCTELRDGKLKVLSSSDGQVKRETVFLSSITGPESQKGGMFNGHTVHASDNGDVAKLMKSSADASTKVGASRNSGNFTPHRPLNTSSPVRANSSLTASMALQEATKLKDTADQYKNSGFEFESNETYFEAALKFLHGASLLENCQSESSKHGEMSQLQIYATTAKLFKSCALEYEKRHEMAAAALAYKCMEVAYMRVVYCKSSSTNRLWHEMQSALHMVPQDVDNLINQAAVDKTTLSRDTGTHVTPNQALSVGNHPTLFRLLDFTQDVNFAMEASRKCQSTFAAASVFMEEARNKECIASIRRVVDFSFQDVDELVRLAWAATKAISRAVLDGARD
ncbi:uncharacterized protein G2W53_034641 [Senna tora]|uniref:CW-type domain-containing protein n=1 Tax=Senna tora TaxID=362788 RepID=A0A834W800_9FABA|nr:uncharacterized protein G2W53_034641 [Senna tora]